MHLTFHELQTRSSLHSIYKDFSSVQNRCLVLEISVKVVHDVLEHCPLRGVHLIRIAILWPLLEQLNQQGRITVFGQIADVLVPRVRVIEEG